MTKFNRTTFALLACAALSLLPASRAFADPSSADVESGKVAYREGKELRAKGDLQGALGRFKAAFALVPTPITGLEVGKAYIALGSIIEGRDALLSIERMPKKPDESEKAADARKEAGVLAEAVKPKLAAVTINTSADEKEPPHLNVDGTEIPPDAAHAPRVLNPGHHVIVMHVSGKTGRVEVDLQEGEQRAVNVPLAREVVEPLVPPVTEASGKWTPNALVYGGFGVGALGLVVGVVTGGVALSKASTVKSECPNGQCPPAAHSDLNLTNAMSTTSTIAFIIGGIGVAVGVAGIFTSKRQPAATAWINSLHVTAGLGTLSASGAF